MSPEKVDGGMVRKILGYDDSILMAHVSFEKGDEGYVHEHVHSQVTYVVSGAFDVTIGDETRRLEAGDSFYVEPHVLHGAVCQESGVLIDVFSPVREDFLAEA